jgi:hypothetical protein
MGNCRYLLPAGWRTGGGADLSVLIGAGGGRFINALDHVIKGNGAILAPLDNAGLFCPEGGTRNIDTPVTGGGQVEVADGTRLRLNQDLTTGLALWNQRRNGTPSRISISTYRGISPFTR